MGALELSEVRKVYEQGDTEIVALDHATLAVGDVEILALVGPAGSGNTTLISIAGGLLSPSDGSVVVGGQDITAYDARRLTQFRRDEVGFVFQAVNLVPFLTARENVMVAAELAGRRRETDVRPRADRLHEELGLGARARNLPNELSGGERQRVAIGRALMNEPKLVLVDEPTSALDTSLGEQVMDLIVREVKGRSTAAIVVTHDTRMTHFCDRTVHIVDGRLEAA
jgi:putative ABC transport system ATP-binding protein